jgi:hypothetical protein
MVRWSADGKYLCDEARWVISTPVDRFALQGSIANRYISSIQRRTKPSSSNLRSRAHNPSYPQSKEPSSMSRNHKLTANSGCSNSGRTEGCTLNGTDLFEIGVITRVLILRGVLLCTQRWRSSRCTKYNLDLAYSCLCGIRFMGRHLPKLTVHLNVL